MFFHILTEKLREGAHQVVPDSYGTGVQGGNVCTLRLPIPRHRLSEAAWQQGELKFCHLITVGTARHLLGAIWCLNRKIRKRGIWAPQRAPWNFAPSHEFYCVCVYVCVCVCVCGCCIQNSNDDYGDVWVMVVQSQNSLGLPVVKKIHLFNLIKQLKNNKFSVFSVYTKAVVKRLTEP